MGKANISLMVAAPLVGAMRALASSIRQPFTFKQKEASQMRRAKVFLKVAVALFVAVFLGQMGWASQAQAQGAGSALEFDGTDDYVNCGKDGSLDITEITIEAWIKPDVIPFADYLRIVSKGWPAYELMGVNGADELRAQFGVSYAWKHLDTSGADLEAGNWYHVAWTYTSGDCKIYVNGEVKGSTTTITGPIDISTTTNLLIGSSEVHEIPWDGTIDEVRIWNVVRSQDQIREYMCKKLTGSESGLVGYWQLNDGAGTTASDQTPYGNDGTLYGFSSGWAWSTAPIGDVSTYTTAGVDLTLTHPDGDYVEVKNISNTPTYAALIGVGVAPNYTGVDATLDHVGPLRYCEVWMTGGTTYDLVYHYEGHPGITDENYLRLGKRADATINTWSDAGAALSTDANTLTLEDETGSQYILASETTDNPLPIELSSFTATAGDGRVTLRWATESEVDNLGFNIYRSLAEDGEYVKLTHGLIEGAGNSAVRNDYSYTDSRLTNGVTYWYKLEDVDFQGVGTMHGPVSATPTVPNVEPEIAASAPDEFSLSQNYPNPFNPDTRITFSLKEAGHVSLKIYNVLGQEVRTLVDTELGANEYTAHWDGRDGFGRPVASGVYFYRLKTASFARARKMLLVR